jgi:hypothetical protein
LPFSGKVATEVDWKEKGSSGDPMLQVRLSPAKGRLPAAAAAAAKGKGAVGLGDLLGRIQAQSRHAEARRRLKFQGKGNVEIEAHILAAPSFNMVVHSRMTFTLENILLRHFANQFRTVTIVSRSQLLDLI